MALQIGARFAAAMLLVASACAGAGAEQLRCWRRARRSLREAYPSAALRQSLAYAADKAKDAPEEEITDASFVGQYELEEREDADSAKTLMELTADGKALLGSTDGIPFAEAKGRWEYDGKELILELTRTFEDVKSTFSTTRVFIGDVIALNDVPPQVQGAIKMTPSPTSDDMLRIPRHTRPRRVGRPRRREDPRDPGRALGAGLDMPRLTPRTHPRVPAPRAAASSISFPAPAPPHGCVSIVRLRSSARQRRSSALPQSCLCVGHALRWQAASQ